MFKEGDYVTVVEPIDIDGVKLLPGDRFQVMRSFSLMFPFYAIRNSGSTIYFLPERLLAKYDAPKFNFGFAKKEEKEDSDVFSVTLSDISDNLTEDEITTFVQLFQKAKFTKKETPEQREKAKSELLKKLSKYAIEPKDAYYTLAIVKKDDGRVLKVVSSTKSKIINGIYFESKEKAEEVIVTYGVDILKYL